MTDGVCFWLFHSFQITSWSPLQKPQEKILIKLPLVAFWAWNLGLKEVMRDVGWSIMWIITAEEFSLSLSFLWFVLQFNLLTIHERCRLNFLQQFSWLGSDICVCEDPERQNGCCWFWWFHLIDSSLLLYFALVFKEERSSCPVFLTTFLIIILNVVEPLLKKK